MRDDPTLAFYDDNAAAYAERARTAPRPELIAFLDALPTGARVLELGTGSGADARVMLDRGFTVTATDGSAGLAHHASLHLGQEVRLLRFDELSAEQIYDGVWASACLLHVPTDDLSGILRRIYRALVTGGLFVASFKAGDGPGRDQLGRYYNYPDEQRLEWHYRGAGPWQSLTITSKMGSGYDNLPTHWLWATVRR